MLKVNIFALGIMAALISLLGFIVENIWLAMTKGYMNNRNMNMPFLLGYGCLVIVMYLILGTPETMVLPFGIAYGMTKYQRYLAYFVISVVVVSISELLLGNIVEYLCGIEYWNYEWIPFHLTKYTSIPTSMGFATIITFFMDNCFGTLISWIMKMDADRMRILSILLIVVMVVDFAVSFGYMIKHKELNTKWRISFEGKRPELEILR